jgi:hypothetical protein
MSTHEAAGELLMDPSGAVVAAIRDNGWVAGPWRHKGFRLAGGPLDSHANFVTDLHLLTASVAVETRIPVQLPSRRRLDALLLCSAVNAGSGIVSIDPDRVPVLHTRLIMVQPEGIAAAVIADAIRRQRQIAHVVTPAFLALVRGEPLTRIVGVLGLASQLPFATDPQPAAELDLSRTPNPSDKALEEARQLPITEAEVMALARVQTLNETQPHAEQCAGPLIIHADGVVECYGCTDPLHYIHGGGCSASCRPARRLGIGHRCQRCNAPLASG